MNKIQILVNGLGPDQKQMPLWLKQDNSTASMIEVLAQEDFFEADKKACLPTFNSLTIENQIFNTQSSTDKARFFFPSLFLFLPFFSPFFLFLFFFSS